MVRAVVVRSMHTHENCVPAVHLNVEDVIADFDDPNIDKDAILFGSSRIAVFRELG